MIQLLLNKTTPPFQLLPMLITHSCGAAFTVSEKSSNTMFLGLDCEH